MDSLGIDKYRFERSALKIWFKTVFLKFDTYSWYCNPTEKRIPILRVDHNGGLWTLKSHRHDWGGHFTSRFSYVYFFDIIILSNFCKCVGRVSYFILNVWVPLNSRIISFYVIINNIIILIIELAKNEQSKYIKSNKDLSSNIFESY